MQIGINHVPRVNEGLSSRVIYVPIKNCGSIKT
jgi:hypothetical protein